MLGQYENFPESVHRVAQFTHKNSVRKLQQVIIETFSKLNESSVELGSLIPFSREKWDVSFEFGVADGLTFNFIDKEEVERFRKIATKEALSILDFLCVTGYHTVNKSRRVPRRFDYQFLRFIFVGNTMELHIVHERGIQRIPLEELAAFLKRSINAELSEKGLKQLSSQDLQTL